jgi:hypothetical protein
MVHGYLGLSGMDVAHGAACLIFNSLKKLANANKLRAEVPFPSYLQSFQLKTARSRNSRAKSLDNYWECAVPALPTRNPQMCR